MVGVLFLVLAVGKFTELSLSLSLYIYIYMCVCVHIYVRIYIFVCLFVCLPVTQFSADCDREHNPKLYLMLHTGGLGRFDHFYF